MFFQPFTIKFPLLYNAIVRTGLASIPEIGSLDSVGTNVLLPPCIEKIPEMNDSKLREMLIQLIPIFLHNAFVANDYPLRNDLKKILKLNEKSLKNIHGNSWLILMKTYGEKGLCPSLENIDMACGPFDKVSLALSRPEWDTVSPKVVCELVDWMITNRHVIQKWHADRLSVFK